MRLLHVTDTHLGIQAFYRGAPPGWTRADDHTRAFRAAVLPAMRGEVDAVIHSGDLFDRSAPPPRAIEEAREILAALGRRVPVLLAPGNHDRHGVGRHFPGGIPGVRLFDEGGVADVGGVRIGVVPFVREPEAFRAAAPACDLLVAHQTFHGARVPGYTFRAGVQPDTIGEAHLPPARWILCGHIHPRQVLTVGGAEIVHAGSTERTAFSERGETKGVVHWEIGRAVTWRYADLPSRPMVVVAAVADLDAITPGALVRLEGPARDEAVEDEALRRGGWVAPYRKDRGQLRLFG